MNIQCCHDDYSIWFDVTPQNQYVQYMIHKICTVFARAHSIA